MDRVGRAESGTARAELSGTTKHLPRHRLDTEAWGFDDRFACEDDIGPLVAERHHKGFGERKFAHEQDRRPVLG